MPVEYQFIDFTEYNFSKKLFKLRKATDFHSVTKVKSVTMN